jgi:hypothetical protein
MNHAIPAVYRGIEYRSRLEARWAAFFDETGWKHTYEPFDGTGYIPDFLIHGAPPFLAEIKPAVTEDDYRAPIPKIETGLNGCWDHDILILGADPLPILDTSCGSGDHPAAGVLGQRYATVDAMMLGGVRTEMDSYLQLPPAFQQHATWVTLREPGWNYATACWFRCCLCGAVCVYHSEQDWGGRPCGHYWGDQHLGHIEPFEIEDPWAEACNAVKWYGADA